MASTAPTTRDIAAELAPIVGMHVAQRAALRIVKHRAEQGPFEMFCFGCDAGRHEPRQFCELCNDVTDSYPAVGGGL
jgi:hypothetical protein